MSLGLPLIYFNYVIPFIKNCLFKEPEFNQISDTICKSHDLYHLLTSHDGTLTSHDGTIIDSPSPLHTQLDHPNLVKRCRSLSQVCSSYSVCFVSLFTSVDSNIWRPN